MNTFGPLAVTFPFPNTAVELLTSPNTALFTPAAVPAAPPPAPPVGLDLRTEVELNLEEFILIFLVLRVLFYS